MKKYLLIILISASVKAHAQTEYGIICGKCSDKAAAAKSVGATWVRVDMILSTYKGKNILKRYYDSGLNVIVTVKWSTRDTFSVNTDKYKTMLDSFVRHNLPADTSKKLFIVIGNEELNPSHNYGYASQYVNMLNAAVTIAEKYNLPISNGGLTFSILKVKIFISKMNEYKYNEGNKFASICVPQTTLDKLQNPTYNIWRDLNFLDTVISGIASIKYNKFYTNFHYYAPAIQQKTIDSSISTVNKDSSFIIKETAQWLRDKTKHEIISNEMGQFNSSPDLVKSEINNAVKNKLSIVIWHTGDDVPAIGIFNDYSTLELRENGKELKKTFSKKIKAKN